MPSQKLKTGHKTWSMCVLIAEICVLRSLKQVTRHGQCVCFDSGNMPSRKLETGHQDMVNVCVDSRHAL